MAIRGEKEEQALRSNDRDRFNQSEILQLISLANPVAIAIIDTTEFRIDWCNEMFQTLTRMVLKSSLDPQYWNRSIIGARIRDLSGGYGRSGTMKSYRQAAETGQPVQEAPFKVVMNNKTTYWQCKIMPMGNSTERVSHLMSTFIEVTEQITAEMVEMEREATIAFLRMVNDGQGTGEMIQKAATFFQKQSGCEAVGLRLQKGEDFPYREARGFSDEFVRSEAHLCRKDEHGNICRDPAGVPILGCMCGNVICGHFDMAEPFFTEHGSFWTNSTTELLASTTEIDRRARKLKGCNGEGYESVALIPLRLGEERLGLLQMNDRRKGMFSPELISQWERLAGYLAVALAKFRTDEALRESEAKYRGIVDNLPEVVSLRKLVHDDAGEIIDGILMDANPTGLLRLGVSSIDEVRGKLDSELLSPEMLARWLETMRRLRVVGVPITEEVHYDLNDRYYLTTFVPLGNDHVITTAVDITDIKRAQKALAENFEAVRQHAEEVEALMDIVPSAIWVAHDPEGRVITGNRAADQIYEATQGENVSAGPTSGGPQDTTRRFFRDGRELRPEELPIQEAVTKGVKISNSEIEVLLPSGETKTILGDAQPLFDTKGKVRGCIASFMDITDRRKMELELEATKARLEAIINQMPVGILVADARSGELLFVNEETIRIHGLSSKPTDIKEFLYHTRLARRQPEGLPYRAEGFPFIRSLSGEVIKSELAEIRRQDGSDVFISGSSAPVYDSRGAIVASVALYIDVTETVMTQRHRDRLLDDLEASSLNLKRSNDELQQFAYVASHDLQEPLRMVTAYLSLLDKKYGDQLDGKAQQYMKFAIEGGLRAKDLVRDLLEVARVDSQAKPMSSTDMNDVMDKVCSNLGIQINEEHGTVSRDPLPTIMADRAQMTTLLQNLISNAIKFHGDEEPKIRVSCEEKDEQWLFSVSDNGIGIDKQYGEKVFAIFQRLHSREEYEGTGIGLAIAKKIVERHGGRIWFESQTGQGTTFYFTMPRDGKK
jgi:signal transduction histidine kinase/GAF domain-containing protein